MSRSQNSLVTRQGDRPDDDDDDDDDDANGNGDRQNRNGNGIGNDENDEWDGFDDADDNDDSNDDNALLVPRQSLLDPPEMTCDCIVQSVETPALTSPLELHHGAVRMTRNCAVGANAVEKRQLAFVWYHDTLTKESLPLATIATGLVCYLAYEMSCDDLQVSSFSIV